MDRDLDLDEADAVHRELDLEFNGGGGGGDDLDVAAGAAPVVNNETATYQDLALLPPSQPIMFERTRIDFAINVNQVPVWFPRRGRPELIDNIIYAPHFTGPPAARRAYWMHANLRQCLYGSIRIGFALRPHLNEAAVPWELTEEVVAVKALPWPRIRERRFTDITDDPLSEVAALQFVMHQAQQNNINNITTVWDVLQDGDCLFIVMPFYDYSSLADVVLQAREQHFPEARAIPEPIAKAFFVRILQVRTIPGFSCIFEVFCC